MLCGLSSDVTCVEGVEGVSVAGADRVVVAASILAVVGAVLLAPGLGVEGAVSAVGDVVDGQEVGIVEVAGVVGAVRARVALVVGGCGRAGCSAFAGVVDTGEVLHANVGVLAGGVERGVDGAAEFGGAVEAGLWVRWVELGVAW